MPAGEKGQKKKASKNQILNASFLHNVAPGNSPCASFLAEPLQPLRLLRSSARELTLRFVPGLDFARQPSEIAPTGHTPAQEPQLMQVLGSISNLPSPMLIAPTGHAPSQEPQATQELPITYAIILSSLFNVGYLVL